MKFIKLHKASYKANDRYIKGPEIYVGINHIIAFKRYWKEQDDLNTYTELYITQAKEEYLKIWETPKEICSFLPYDLAGTR